MDGENVRLLRTGQFADWLSRNGHEVVFWTGAMDHTARKLRAVETTQVEVRSNYKIVLLKGRAYKRSISLDRFLNHREVAAAFEREAPLLPPPDVILTSFPTAELCKKVADYAQKRGIPFVVDARDFWPDIFSELLPKPLRFLSPLAFFPQENLTRSVFSRATAVSGMTESAMQWALRKAGRRQNQYDFWHPFTYPNHAAGGPSSAADFPDPSEIPPPSSQLILCFFGTHSHRVNLEMFVEAFRRLQERRIEAAIVLGGKGPVTDALRSQAKGLTNVYFPGWLNAQQINHVMTISDVGVLPYNTPDFFMNMPNKIADYLHGGLPVLSCTHGEVKSLLEREGCGFWCEPEPDAIADAVAAIADNRAAVREASDRAKDVYARMFDQEAVFQRVLNNLAELANASRRSDARLTGAI
jgi:glycosyltransferase involved in cell wall biosynthesis